MRGRSTFDIQIRHGDRWVTESRMEGEEEAKALALKHLKSAKCQGARVLRCWLRTDGTEDETEIFSKIQQVREESSSHIDFIESAGELCEDLQDYFKPGSRLVLGRLFRSYLDKAVLTPSELLHNGRELKRLRDKDALMPSAVDRIASLQARSAGVDVAARKGQLFKAVEDLIARARKTESVALPKQTMSVAELFAALPPGAAPWEREYLACTALARDLQEVRSFSAKLERLCRLALDVADPGQIALMDSLIAELLETSAIQDVLGWQPGLGHAICSLLDLADGTMATTKSDAPEAAQLLNRLFAEQRLPACRLGLIDRAHRQIAAASPLYRSDEKQEYDTFKKVVQRMLTPAGLLGNAATAAALTTRCLHMIKDSGRKGAVAAVFRAMPDRAYGILYLCGLADGEFADEAAGKLAEAYPPGIGGQHITNIVHRTLSPKDRMVRATAAYRAVAAAPFPGAVKQPLLDHIDRLLDEYLVEEKVIEKLDNPEGRLRDRALRLVQFCASGVLPEGKALSRARQRIRDLLRQPNFDAHFVEGIGDPAKARQALRDFHQLLVNKAGFSV